MQITDTPTITGTTVHNPSSCTCSRIVWLSTHCDFFAMNMSTPERDARIDAKIGINYQGVQFRPEMLKEAVAGVFWEMWRTWEPAEGLKVIQEQLS